MSALRFNRKGRRASTNHGWKSVNQSCHLQWVSREVCAIYPAPPLFGGKKMPAGCQGNRPLDIRFGESPSDRAGLYGWENSFMSHLSFIAKAIDDRG